MLVLGKGDMLCGPPQGLPLPWLCLNRDSNQDVIKIEAANVLIVLQLGLLKVGMGPNPMGSNSQISSWYISMLGPGLGSGTVVPAE